MDTHPCGVEQVLSVICISNCLFHFTIWVFHMTCYVQNQDNYLAHFPNILEILSPSACSIASKINNIAQAKCFGLLDCFFSTSVYSISHCR